ncbi:hypothetical protein [Paractinoplanes brasiliensis]|uniref:Uncharacterized protein n=1 Tax=Paractinoplanes brasiliensis TaxID=52695 RepID=A0A4V3C8E5_9ACTN|nr:hypothetical protein [Actinoplanes brasiliensis]TDO40638.1 hypothetical protein C8E87_4357 [Actinoplanes brasiliensis]GID25707.1 hypothetical protein Abr02nite_06900 [Actinoplanes brasiliensis]
MSVSAVLFRLYRPVILWGLAIVVVLEIGAVAAILTVNPLGFSFWLVVVGSAAKYWPLVTGIIMISTYFRQFVTNGVTRHEFLRGFAVFALGIVVLFPALVVIGHGVESTVVGLLDQRGGGYPAFRFGEAANEYLHVLPATAAYLTSGILISAGFYRFRPLIGILLIVPASLPVVASGGLVNIDEYGVLTERGSLGLALTVVLAATAAAGLAAHRLMRDVAIRRTG